jgi:uncharacterized tellurite resistance protein B-like protein
MAQDEKRETADTAFFESQMQAIITKATSPASFATLSIEQRKYLFALILASIVPADGRVREVEMKNLLHHLAEKYHMQAKALERAAALVSSPAAAPDTAKRLAGRMPDFLSIDDRCAMVGALWEIALCDKELHDNEEQLIFEIADQAGVPRKKVAELQARAAARLRA